MTRELAHTKFDPPKILTKTSQKFINHRATYTHHYIMNCSIINRALTTPDEDREDNSYYFTPARTKVHGDAEFYDRIGIEHFKEDIFRTFNVSSRDGWRFLNDRTSSRRLGNDLNVEEHRGSQPLISLKKIWEMEPILETEGIEGHDYTWEQLGFEVGLECLS